MAKVDVAFPLSGTTIPADYAYGLYGAVCRLIPALHVPDAPQDRSNTAEISSSEVGFHPINASPCSDGLLAIGANSRVRIRVPVNQLGVLLPLAGAELEIDGAKLRLGVPQIEPLRPAVRLRSRLVIIKGFVEPEPFLAAVNKQLQAIQVAGRAGIPYRKGMVSDGKSPLVRRTVRIRDKVIVGYAVEVDELTAEESIRLQELGVGGRRHFGCGIFVPMM